MYQNYRIDTSFITKDNFLVNIVRYFFYLRRDEKLKCLSIVSNLKFKLICFATFREYFLQFCRIFRWRFICVIRRHRLRHLLLKFLVECVVHFTALLSNHMTSSFSWLDFVASKPFIILAQIAHSGAIWKAQSKETPQRSVPPPLNAAPDVGVKCPVLEWSCFYAEEFIMIL